MTEEKVHICFIALCLINAEYGANAHVYINIGRAIQGVKEKDIIALWILGGYIDQLSDLLRTHAAELPDMLHSFYDHSIGKYIQLLNPLLLHIDIARVPKNIHQTRFVYLPRDHFGGDD